MKPFALALAFIASEAVIEVLGARFQPNLDSPSRGFQEGAGRNGTNGQMARFSKASTAVITEASSTNPKWTLYLWSVFYEDSGTTRIRIKHSLTANIFATDTVNFEIAYRAKNLGKVLDSGTIGEDYVQCDMS